MLNRGLHDPVHLYTKVLSRFKRPIPFFPPSAILFSTANLPSFCKVMHVRMRVQLHPINRTLFSRFLLQSPAIRFSALHIFSFFLLLNRKCGKHELSPFVFHVDLLYLFVFCRAGQISNLPRAVLLIHLLFFFLLFFTSFSW